jgi:cytochrome d ubiquinol oxidase subunit II
MGVGMLHGVLGRDDAGRRAVISTIGPLWDGNEVWLVVAGAAMFAAFPGWYASLFSGFYLALLVILVALIVRGVAFEFRGKIDSDRWRANWDRAIIFGSSAPALLWGVAFANIVHGVPLDSHHNYTGTFVTLLNPYALLGGLTTLVLFTLHGAAFLSLRTTGEVRDRSRAIAKRLGLAAVPVAGSFLVWTQLSLGDGWTVGPAVLAAIALVAAVGLVSRGREGWAFVCTAATVKLAVLTLFVALYPNVLPSTTDPAGTLTTLNASSTPYTLTIMTWVAVVFTPIVLLYQAWSYWVFRARIGRADIPGWAGLPSSRAKAAGDHGAHGAHEAHGAHTR